ncbi:MAG TPA: hypothetical protein VHR18_01095 [Solirubrobacterales bacterium]|nr:hypothetical protein [Solirubrobacterales bacterium]
MSRFRIFTLLATAVALAGAFAACGGSDSSSEDPQQVIETATLEGVKSGTIDLSLGVKADGDSGGDLSVSLSGPFQSRGPETLPELDMDVSAKGDVDGEAVDFTGGITLLSDRAFIGYEGSEYEVDPTTFGFVKSGFEQGLSEAGAEGESSSADVTACQEALAGIDLTTVIDNLESDGSADVDGTSTTKVSGNLNPEGAVDAIIALTEDPACSSQLEAAGPLPLDELEAARGEVSKAVKDAHVEVYVGDDDIIRKAVAEITIEPKDASAGKVELDFELTLGGVNESQKIAAPDNAQPLEGLFNELNIDPTQLLEAGSGGGLGGLLEGIGGDSGADEAESPELEIDPEDLPSAEASQEYLECLQEAKTANDLQDCASLLG